MNYNHSALTQFTINGIPAARILEALARDGVVWARIDDLSVTVFPADQVFVKPDQPASKPTPAATDDDLLRLAGVYSDFHGYKHMQKVPDYSAVNGKIRDAFIAGAAWAKENNRYDDIKDAPYFQAGYAAGMKDGKAEAGQDPTLEQYRNLMAMLEAINKNTVEAAINSERMQRNLFKTLDNHVSEQGGRHNAITGALVETQDLIVAVGEKVEAVLDQVVRLERVPVPEGGRSMVDKINAALAAEGKGNLGGEFGRGVLAAYEQEAFEKTHTDRGNIDKLADDLEREERGFHPGKVTPIEEGAPLHMRPDLPNSYDRETVLLQRDHACIVSQDAEIKKLRERIMELEADKAKLKDQAALLLKDRNHWVEKVNDLKNRVYKTLM